MSASKTARTKTERRDTPRVPIALDAMVKLGDRPYQMFQTRDLSLDGAFVETGPHRVGSKERLQVALKISVGGAPQIYRFDARVTRIAPQGVGMVFDHVNTESYAALLDFVFSAQPRGSY